MPKVIQQPRYSEVYRYFWDRHSPSLAGMQDVNRVIHENRNTPLLRIGCALNDNWGRLICLSELIGKLVAHPNEKGGITIRFDDIDEYVEKVIGAAIGVEALVNSIVTGSWTMFEVLAADLWIALVDMRPNDLVPQLTARNPQNPVQVGKVIEIATIADFGYDLRDKMGQVLSEKFSLSLLVGIQKAYKQAFGKGSAFVSILDDFDLASLSACRNALVHNGGVVDQTFLDRVVDDPELKTSVLTDTVELRGPIVCRLIGAARRASLAIFQEGDKWLKGHPPS